jgi:serine protease Do
LLLQTDARIQLGCSGGALLNLDGKLVGLTTAQAAMVGAETDGGFAIPINAGIRRVIDVLRKGEEVEYGFLGVATDRVPFARRAERGVYLNRITPNSPADRAGLRAGEQVIAIDGQPVNDYDDMFLHIGLGMAGREIVIKTMRPGGPKETRVRLAKFPLAESGKVTHWPEDVYGLRVDYVSVISRTALDPMPDGVVVREVIKDSPAEQKKLTEHTDIITEINGVPVTTPKEFYLEAEKATRHRQPVRLTLINPPRVITLP